MWTFVIALLVIWVVLSVVGFVIEGLLWLAVIGIILFFATVVFGWMKRKASSR